MSAVALQSFGFGDQLVRVFDRDGTAWFVANDVCASLEIENPRNAMARLEDDEKGVHTMDTLGGAQQMTIISESGVYALIFTSRKSAAKRFRKWVTQEVLPAIRETGRYEVPPPAANEDRVLDMQGVLGTSDDRHAIKTALLLINTYKDLYGQQAGRDMLMKLGFPVPGVELPQAPAPGQTGPVEGDLHQWSMAAGVKPSRRDATHLRELYDSYVKWCSATQATPMHSQKFRDAMVMLFNHEEHPEMIRVVMTR